MVFKNLYSRQIKIAEVIYSFINIITLILFLVSGFSSKPAVFNSFAKKNQELCVCNP